MKREIKNLISTGKVKKAIAEISKFFSIKGEEVPDTLIMMSSRHNSNQTMFNSDQISLDEFRKQEAKINKSLLDMVDSLGDITHNMSYEPGNHRDPSQKCLLFVAGCNPKQTNMDLTGEYLEIRKIFKPFSRDYYVTEEFDATLDDLFEAIKSDCPDILHFSGIGAKDGIYLVDDISKDSMLIPNDYLASALRMAECGDRNCRRSRGYRFRRCRKLGSIRALRQAQFPASACP